MTMQANVTANKNHWSKFAIDFDARVDYIAGKKDVRIIKNFLAMQKNLGKTLELGCGTGGYSEILRHEAERLVATDISDEMLAASKERFKGIENVAVEKADCFSIPFQNDSFDTVFMANLLHVIPEPEKAVAEGKRVLKENGRIIVISFTTEGMGFFGKLGMGRRYLKTFGKPLSTAQVLTVEKVREILQLCGFEIEQATLLGNKSKAIYASAIVRSRGILGMF